jgi:hypothetical protein
MFFGQSVLMLVLTKVMFKNLLRFVDLKLVFKVNVYICCLFKIVYEFIFFCVYNVERAILTFVVESTERKNLKSIDIKFETVKTVRLNFCE